MGSLQTSRGDLLPIPRSSPSSAFKHPCYIQDLCHCNEALHAWPLPSKRLGPLARRSCGPGGPAVQYKPQPPSGSICEGHLSACSWFRNRCGSFRHLVPNQASVLWVFQRVLSSWSFPTVPGHVRGRADREAAASQQGLPDLSQAGRLQGLRAAELISCPDVSLALLSVYSSSLPLSLLPCPPTGKHG